MIINIRSWDKFQHLPLLYFWFLSCVGRGRWNMVGQSPEQSSVTARFAAVHRSSSNSTVSESPLAAPRSLVHSSSILVPSRVCHVFGTHVEFILACSGCVRFREPKTLRPQTSYSTLWLHRSVHTNLSPDHVLLRLHAVNNFLAPRSSSKDFWWILTLTTYYNIV